MLMMSSLEINELSFAHYGTIEQVYHLRLSGLNQDEALSIIPYYKRHSECLNLALS